MKAVVQGSAQVYDFMADLKLSHSLVKTLLVIIFTKYNKLSSLDFLPQKFLHLSLTSSFSSWHILLIKQPNFKSSHRRHHAGQWVFLPISHRLKVPALAWRVACLPDSEKASGSNPSRGLHV